MRIILMGTGPFAVPAFDAIRAQGYNIVCVVTRPAQQVKSRKGPPPNLFALGLSPKDSR